MSGYLYDDPKDCIVAGAHLRSVDRDGYCNACGHQESAAERGVAWVAKPPPRTARRPTTGRRRGATVKRRSRKSRRTSRRSRKHGNSYWGPPRAKPTFVEEIKDAGYTAAIFRYSDDGTYLIKMWVGSGSEETSKPDLRSARRAAKEMLTSRRQRAAGRG